MTSPDKNKTLTLMGGGVFASALAHLWTQRGHKVQMWTRRKEQAAEINATHKNIEYTGDFRFSTKLTASSNIEEALHNSSCVIYALAAKGLKNSLKILNSVSLPFVNTAKGFEHDQQLLHSEIFKKHFGKQVFEEFYYSLSGPSFAKEMLKNSPTCVTLAGHNESERSKVRNLLSTKYFRLYDSPDLTGVQLGGSLKNIVAIIVGAVDALELGRNTEAAIINKGLGEILKVSTAMGAKLESGLGLSGMGDLVLTCNGKLSRNRQFGYWIAKGLSAQEALKKVGSTVEGYQSAKTFMKIKESLSVETPIMDEAYKVLFENKKVEHAIENLLTRPLRSEWK